MNGRKWLIHRAYRPLSYDGGGAIHKNLPEFRELTTCHLFMVYVLDMVFCRELSAALEAVDGADAVQA